MDATAGMVQIHLEELGKHSWTGAVLGAVIGAAGGPPYRFVAASTDADHDASDHAAVGAKFPVLPFKDLEDQTEADKWTDLAHQRLNELDAELMSSAIAAHAERNLGPCALAPVRSFLGPSHEGFIDVHARVIVTRSP